jgi:ribosomal protein L31E
MAFNLFGSPTKDDIRVGYIDPNLGLVEGVTICQANDYAKLNPGTTFIFRNGNNILQYLNVNEVNQLDPNILTSTDECGGINQKKECGPPTIQLFGGGGVGAAGNPIIGRDGSLLAVDVVRGGNGYQYPPLVAARDNCNYGSGATLTAVLGEVAEIIETYENESDFEDYEICDPTDVGYGRLYGPDGEDLGPWEPKLYTDPGEDPIRKEIEEFQKIVRKLAGKPFFSTRKNKPTKITCDDSKIIPQKYDVTFPAWNEFMNTYAISPVSPSNVRGTDYAGKVFTFEWTQEFPTDGEYIFRGLCDNSAQLYVNGSKISDLRGFNSPVTPIQKTFAKGIYNIRVDLLNDPITETVAIQSTPPAELDSSICISVIDEASPGLKTQQADWDSFRKNYPQRKVYILDPGGRGGFKNRIPSGFNSNNNAFGPIAVNRDDGKTDKRSDWFSICGLSGLPAGTVVSLSIDNSGSMRSKTVLASYTYFKQRCNAAGIVLVDTTFKGERFISTHNKPLPSGPKLESSAKPVVSTKTIISSRSWNENPMGLALTIDAPNPPIPQEPKPQQEGRCPTNPIWTTRFPGAAETWYPVRYLGEKIERTINVPPLAEQQQVQETQEVEFSIFGQGGKPISGYSFTFTAVDGQHTFTLNGVQKSNETRVEKIRIRKGVNYVVVASHKDGRKLEQGLIKQGTKKREGGIGEGNKIFADGVKTANDNDDIQVTTNLGKFITLNKSKVGGRSTFELTYVFEGSSSSRSTAITNTPIKQTITTDGWSKFLNRYAISPVPPLDTPASDIGGVLFSNSWSVDIPYDGFYKFITEYDDDGRVLLDGNLAFTFQTAQNDIWKGLSNKVKSQKVFITKGRHAIGIELENRKTETRSQISQKIFRTMDWHAAPTTPEYVEVDFNVYRQGGNRAIVPATFTFTSEDGKESFTIVRPDINKETRVDKIKVRPNINYKVVASGTRKGDSRLEQGLIKSGTSKKETGVGTSNKIFADFIGSANDNDDLQITAQQGSFTSSNRRSIGSRSTFDLTFKVDPQQVQTSGQVTSGTVRDGVTYEGPTIFHYKDNRWNTFMNNHSLSPVIPGEGGGGRKTFTWKRVRFPESGQYDITFSADSDAKLIIGGKQVLTSRGFAENPQSFKVNITQGTYDVVIDSEYPYTTPETNTQKYFREINPTGFALEIRKNVSVIDPGSGESWKENPMGIGAILIPPPCPRRIRGRGVVTDVIVNDPGNGYLPPAPQNQGYPVALRLKEVIVENPGINYNCGVDELRITPSNGAELDYICDPFGKIREVKVLNPGLGFTEYPEIRLISETGVNASFRPVFEVVRDPIVLPERLIQVTDLVGLKQTGYVNGRPYYGAVYYDQGVRYAGFYETIGDPVQVYDTLQESITAQITTPASAIERSGTDIRSNDPRLNIPGTPQNLI